MMQSLMVDLKKIHLMNLGGMPNIEQLEKQGMEGPPGAHGGNGSQTDPWSGQSSGGG